MPTRTVLVLAICWLAATMALLVVTAYQDTDFWKVGVPTYITGTGTVALAALTVVLMRREAADRARLERMQTDRELTDAERDARKVVVTVDPPTPALPNQRFARIMITNASDQPIMDVRLRLAVATQFITSQQVGTFTETTATREWFWVAASDADVQVVLPRDSYVFQGLWTDQPGEVKRVYLPDEDSRRSAKAEVSWTDSMGLRWERIGRQGPRRVRAEADLQVSVRVVPDLPPEPI